ncbi:hypothetical protein K466DRAFT_373752 [Polyporus arcularius HHB13444]|uniref:Uncharacterized protein n=1 Tax=Polyporus arcularius HHB13444 TaxID=1314778 RepID=A0A5C3NUV3_9APHY|nr:hypothetical protein K466DRAFT_373752 [Polyporus arcularius HHB13444]
MGHIEGIFGYVHFAWRPFLKLRQSLRELRRLAHNQTPLTTAWTGPVDHPTSATSYSQPGIRPALSGLQCNGSNQRESLDLGAGHRRLSDLSPCMCKTPAYCVSCTVQGSLMYCAREETQHRCAIGSFHCVDLPLTGGTAVAWLGACPRTWPRQEIIRSSPSSCRLSGHYRVERSLPRCHRYPSSSLPPDQLALQDEGR